MHKFFYRIFQVYFKLYFTFFFIKSNFSKYISFQSNQSNFYPPGKEIYLFLIKILAALPEYIFSLILSMDDHEYVYLRYFYIFLGKTIYITYFILL